MAQLGSLMVQGKLHPEKRQIGSPTILSHRGLLPLRPFGPSLSILDLL